MKSSLLALTLIVALAASALAANYYTVNQDGSGDFTTIQAAIDAAEEGDTITVYPGIYYENLSFAGKDLKLHSMDPRDWRIVQSTVLDGRRSGSVVTFEGTETPECELSGFTIQNGETSLSAIGGFGGGVNGSSEVWGQHTRASILNCIFKILIMTVKC